MFDDGFKLLGRNFLDRMQKEMLLLHQVMARGRRGDASAMADARNVAARMRSGCAKLGFLEMRRISSSLELKLKDAGPAPSDKEWSTFSALMQQLQTALRDARFQAGMDA